MKLQAKRWPGRLGWLYLGLLAAATALLRTTGDSWWFGTLLCFAPRWVLLAPLPLLALYATFNWRRRLPAFLFACVLGWIWIDYSFPSLAIRSPDPAAWRFRIATFNTQGDAGDLESFVAWAREGNLDVVVFQEPDFDRLRAAIGENWRLAVGHRGVAIASRHEIANSDHRRWHDSTGRGECMYADLIVGGRIVRVGGVHLPTPRSGLEALLRGDPSFIQHMAAEREFRRSASKQASEFLLEVHGVDVAAGDFNMPFESSIYRECWGSLVNAFSEVGSGLGRTKFTRWHGVRIDHILIGNGNIAAIDARVGPSFDSDHRPLVATLALPPPRRKIKSN